MSLCVRSADASVDGWWSRDRSGGGDPVTSRRSFATSLSALFPMPEVANSRAASSDQLPGLPSEEPSRTDLLLVRCGTHSLGLLRQREKEAIQFLAGRSKAPPQEKHPHPDASETAANPTVDRSNMDLASLRIPRQAARDVRYEDRLLARPPWRAARSWDFHAGAQEHAAAHSTTFGLLSLVA